MVIQQFQATVSCLVEVSWAAVSSAQVIDEVMRLSPLEIAFHLNIECFKCSAVLFQQIHLTMNFYLSTTISLRNKSLERRDQ